jgi:hypothetical protein
MRFADFRVVAVGLLAFVIVGGGTASGEGVKPVPLPSRPVPFHGVFSEDEWRAIEAARRGDPDPRIRFKATTICTEKCKVCATPEGCDFECASKKCGRTK